MIYPSDLFKWIFTVILGTKAKPKIYTHTHAYSVQYSRVPALGAKIAISSGVLPLMPPPQWPPLPTMCVKRLRIHELKCDINISPKRLVTSLLHQISFSVVVSTSVGNEGVSRLKVTTT
jgi:hypothetical protein